MADKLALNDVAVKYELTAIEKAWLSQSLSTQRAVLVRARTKERPGSEIDQLRGREIAELDRLLAKLS